ncbi:SDR family oxidoreductase [Herbiconiux sp. P16]|uniref:SDR family oxidoreductase n=1 Tax=Herbiconiux wuyangfengii TaxID=3342794 RepID=UPI003CED2C3F
MSDPSNVGGTAAPGAAGAVGAGGIDRIVVITGASSGFGALTARALADSGNTVYAGMRETTGRNAAQVTAASDYSREHDVDLRSIDLDVNSQESVDAAVAQVLAAHGRIDVLIHNAGHMVTGPAEAFTPEQLAELYDVNVLSTQRVNRAALPSMRAAGKGLVLWVSSSSVKGGTPPYLAPYFAAKAAMDSLAVSYAGELARWGVETSIVVPGSFTSGTNHFAHAGHPADDAVEAEYETKYAGLMEQVAGKLAALAPADATASLVSDEIARIVALPAGSRPYRVHIDPANDGSEEVSEVADRIRREFRAWVDLLDSFAVPPPPPPAP